MVDGAPRPGTVLTLSHWPHTPTPAALWADLSAEIVLLALADPRVVPWESELATVDHLDADGLVALAMLCRPGLADEHGKLLVEAARVGDFGVVHDDRGAQVAFALTRVLRPDPGAAGPDPGAVLAAALELLPALCEDPGAHRGLWADEWAAFGAGRRLLEAGAVVVDELDDVDLAVVHVSSDRPGAAAAAWGGEPLHPAVVHSVTDRLRVAVVCDGLVQVRYRYETWVRLARRPAHGRVDLGPLAHELSGLEGRGSGSARWRFDGVGALTPRLRCQGGPSSLEAATVLDRLVDALRAGDGGEPAWDPFD